MSPRLTRAMQKQAEAVAKKFYQPFLYDDPDIGKAFSVYASLLLRRLGIAHPIQALAQDLARDQLGPDGTFTVKGMTTPLTEDEANLILLDVIKAKRPDFFDMIGKHIPFFTYLTLAELREEAPDEQTKQKIIDHMEEIRLPTYELEHLPDNPITVDRDTATGKHTLSDVDNAELKHHMEIRAYLDSLRPARPVGRPRGSPKPKTSGREPLDPEEALRVYQAKLDAPKWSLQQAARVMGKRVPSDLKARERFRARVNRLLDKGARLHRKKSVR